MAITKQQGIDFLNRIPSPRKETYQEAFKEAGALIATEFNKRSLAGQYSGEFPIAFEVIDNDDATGLYDHKFTYEIHITYDPAGIRLKRYLIKYEFLDTSTIIGDAIKNQGGVPLGGGTRQ